MLRSSHSETRRGFTLVEILVVIAIIAILVALTAPALMRVMGRGADTDNKMTIHDLELALTEFQRKYGVFPPSKIRLAPRAAMYGASELDKQSLAFLNRIWPRLSTTGQPFMSANPLQGIDWSGGQRGFMLGNGTVTLEGDQCLVYFLGGIPCGPLAPAAGPAVPPTTFTVGNPIGTLGFSTNPFNPADVFATAANPKPEKVGPFFNFKANRLYQRAVGVAAAGWTFYSYQDSHSDPITNPNDTSKGRHRPYAYFSSGSRENGYNALVTARTPFPTPMNMIRQLAAENDCTSLGVWPYAEFMATAGTAAPHQPPRYHNRNSFQIISAGRDGIFGTGTMVLEISGPAATPLRVPMGSPAYSSSTGLSGSPLQPNPTLTLGTPPAGFLGTTQAPNPNTWAGFWTGYYRTSAYIDDQTNFHGGVLGARAN